jgi:hypothetical protein
MKLKTQIISQAIGNFSRIAFCVTFLSSTLSLSGCGGSGAGAVNSTPSSANKATTGTVDAVTALAKGLDVLTSAPSVNSGSSGNNSANITVVVKDVGNRALQDAVVDLKSNDPQSTLQVFGTKTASDGTLKATLTSTGQSNRNIDIVATVGSLTKTLTIPVSGTVVAVSGPTAVTNGGAGSFSVSVRDAAGVAIANTALTLSSSLGNSFTPATVTTNSLGQATFALNVSKAGTDNVRIAAAGATGTANVTAASTSLSYLNVLASEEISLATPKEFKVKFVDLNGPVGSQTLSISSTKGTVSPSTLSVTTGTNGEASFFVSSTNAGPATITVTGPSNTSVSSQVEFVSKIPSIAYLQPSVAVVASNRNGSTSSTSILKATVRDVNSQPVKGVVVGFRADLDPSGGTLSPATATTDSSGNASVVFTPGATASGSNGVKITSYVLNTPTIAASTNLTVTNSGISIRIGTGNTAENEDSVRNKYLWTALVVDSAGNAVSGAPVQVQVVPLEYRKGFWELLPAASNWSFALTATCLSEDGISPLAPLDGVLQPVEEDLNGNNKLDPGGVATVQFKTLINNAAVTATDGFIDFYIKWAKVYSVVTKVRIDVKTQVNGSEAMVSQEFTLPVLIDDLASGGAPPPSIPLNGFSQSPFGMSNSCRNSN